MTATLETVDGVALTPDEPQASLSYSPLPVPAHKRQLALLFENLTQLQKLQETNSTDTPKMTRLAVSVKATACELQNALTQGIISDDRGSLKKYLEPALKTSADVLATYPPSGIYVGSVLSNLPCPQSASESSAPSPAQGRGVRVAGARPYAAASSSAHR